jgi:FKBP-type peptidyl-prolyl cis-trans isomerase
MTSAASISARSATRWLWGWALLAILNLPVQAEAESEPGSAATPTTEQPSHPTATTKRRDLTKMRATVQNTRKGLAFRQENAKLPGVVNLPSGLQYSVLKQGDGAKPKAGDTVEVYYRGVLLDGTEFVNVPASGTPARLKVAEQIHGLQEGLTRMPVGSIWQLTIPPKLGFGSAGVPPAIGPEATLIYELELVSVRPREAQPGKF